MLDKVNREDLGKEIQEEKLYLVNALKLLDVREAVQDMYSHQWLFEYKDKLGKYIAKILAEVKINQL